MQARSHGKLLSGSRRRCCDSEASPAKAVSTTASYSTAEMVAEGVGMAAGGPCRARTCAQELGGPSSIRRGCRLQETQCPALHMAKEWKSTSFLSTHLAFSQLHINFPLSHQALTVWPPLTDIGSSYLI